MVTVSRNRLFNDEHLKEDTCVKVWYGFHAKTRLDERSKGSLAIRPEVVKLTRQNVVKGYLDNEFKLDRFVIKISYSKKEDLYLVLAPSNYIKNTYFVKSIWFKQRSNVNINNRFHSYHHNRM